MKLFALSCVALFCAGALVAAPADLETSFAALKGAVEKKDAAQVKQLASEIHIEARDAAAEAAPTDQAEKDAWQVRVARAKEIGVYAEYALYATAVQSEPEVMTDLISTLEQQDPKSKYLEDAYAPYFGALRKTGSAAKIPGIAEKALVSWPFNSDILLILTDSAYQGKRYDRAASLGARLTTAVGKKAKPEGVAAAEWEKKKSALLGHGYFIAGMSYYLQNDFFNTDRYLRPGLPYIKGGDEETLAHALYCLGVADYNLGRQTLSRQLMLDGAKFSDEAAKMKSSVSQQAWSNAHKIRAEAEQMRH